MSNWLDAPPLLPMNPEMQILSADHILFDINQSYRLLPAADHNINFGLF